MMYSKCAVAFMEENEVTNISNPDLITIDHIMYIFQIYVLWYLSLCKITPQMQERIHVM